MSTADENGPARVAADESEDLAQEKAFLRDLAGKPLTTRLKGYISLSGPGWLQSALTLGGGSLTGSLYLGVIAGFSLLWLQPLAMILGIIMLSTIGYVTLSTGERPFRAINKHVNPVLGWGWLIASMLANMVWALPQYSLATGVMQQNLLPDLLGPNGSLGDLNAKYVIVGSILVICTIVTWSYGSGHWGVRLYERLLKVVVALIVLCFIGVVVKLSFAEQGVAWGELFGGFVPDFGALFRPSAKFQVMLDSIAPEYREYWTTLIVDKQRDVLMTAFATAVGVNMTFLLPYSMLSRGWGREHRGLAVFDLSTGMFIPFLIATSCVVVASATQFYGQPQPGLVSEVSDGQRGASGKQESEFNGFITGRVNSTLNIDASFARTPEQQASFDEMMAAVTVEEKTLAASLVTRDAADLSNALTPLTGRRIADFVFGLGVLGMAMSTITLLMLVSGFVVCEVLEVPATGWPHRLGCLAAATGALGPFFWGKAAFWLAVPTSVFGLTLLPMAYLTFFLMVNQPSLLGDVMPRGMKRLGINLLAGTATAVALFGCGWAIWAKTRGLTPVYKYSVLGAIAIFIVAIIAGQRRGGQSE